MENVNYSRWLLLYKESKPLKVKTVEKLSSGLKLLVA